MGENLVHLAQTYPEFNFVGMDIYRPGIGALVGRCAKLGLHNVRVIEGMPSRHYKLGRKPLVIASIYFFLTHGLRSVITSDVSFNDGLAHLHGLLAPEGWVHMATDHDGYAEHIEASIDEALWMRHAPTESSVASQNMKQGDCV